MYVERSIGARLCDHCCSGKTIKHIPNVCFRLSYPACNVHHIVICGLSGSATFSVLSHKQHGFRKKKKTVQHKMCVLISSTSFA